jgi:hypothetical protein
MRRRRGIEGLPADDAQLKAALVLELLCVNDECAEVLNRCAVTWLTLRCEGYCQN